MTPMKHLDEISSTAFSEIMFAANATIRDMIKQMGNTGLCPGCMCYLLSEAAKSVGKEYGAHNDAKTH